MTQEANENVAPQVAIWGKRAFVLLLGGILYIGAAFVLAPALIEREVRLAVSPGATRVLAVEQVSFNPFTLAATLSNVSLSGPDQEPLISVARLYLRFYLISPFTRAWDLRELRLDGAVAALQIFGDGEDGLQPLAGAISRALSSVTDSGSLDIEQVTVNDSVVRIVRSGPDGVAAAVPITLRDFELRMDDLVSATARPASFRLNARVDNSAQLQVAGWLTTAPVALDGTFTYSGDGVEALGSYLAPDADTEIRAGAIRAAGKVEYRDGRTRIAGSFKVDDVAIKTAPAEAPMLNVAAIAASEVLFETMPPVVTMGLVRLANPQLKVERNEFGDLDLPSWLRYLITDSSRSAVAIERMKITDGYLGFTDRSMSAPVEVSAHELFCEIEQRRVGAKRETALSLTGRIGATGTGELDLSWLPQDPLQSTRIRLRLGAVDLVALSPYLLSIAGREAASGTMALALQGQVADGVLTLKDDLVVDQLRLGPRGSDAPDHELPLPLFIALSEGLEGRMDLAIPVLPSRIRAGFDPGEFIAEQVRGFVVDRATSPCDVLAVLVGRPGEDLCRIDFVPGETTITSDAAETLAAVRGGLASRPLLSLAVYPGYDQLADSEALARQQVRLHVALATSAAAGLQLSGQAIDFSDPKVRLVLDEFAANRLSALQRQLAESRAAAADDAHYEALFEALVANEKVSTTALKSLARYRAQSVVAHLADAGISTERLRLVRAAPGDGAENQMVALKLESTLQ